MQRKFRAIAMQAISGRSQCRQYRGDRNPGNIGAAGAKFQTIWYNQTASSNNFQ
ncbi:hypothetical protein Q5688_22065 [Microcoleus sp. herbarium5]